ncbi:MAG: sensor histidine kinase [Bacillota bacterium]
MTTVMKAGYSIMDSNYNVLQVDAATRKIYGSHDGKKCYQYFKGREDLCPDCAMAEARRSNAPVVRNVRSGSGGNLQITAVPFQNKTGEWYFVEVTSDIAERRRTEKLIQTYQEKLGALAAELSLAEERERRRIATELHDLIGQTLAVSRIKLGALREMLSSARSVGILDEVREHMEEMIRHTRSMVFELSPPALYMIGLGVALEQLAERTQEKHSLQVDFIDDGLPKSIADETRITLFSGVRELLTNVVKHAQASKVEILLKRKADNIVVEVKDDGVGFTIRTDGFFAKGHYGFGLLSIRERLKHLGGRLKIESRPGGGTRAVMYVPVEKR